MSVISIIDFIYMAFSASALVLVLRNLKQKFPSRRSLILLAFLLSASAFYALFLFLEWSKIDSSLDKFEDILGALLPMLWAFVFYGFSQDVSNRDLQISKQKLRENKHQYRALYESANDAILILKDGIFIDCNPKTLEMFGCKAEEILGKSPVEFSPEIQADGKVSAEKSYEKLSLVYSGRPQFFEWTHKRFDGTLFEAEVSLNLIKLSSGDHSLAIIRDITRRKRAEDELKKLSTAVKQSPLSIVITDPEGNIEYVNPKFCELTGYSASEVIGKNPRILKGDETSTETYKELWQTVLAGNEWHGEFHNRKKNGELYWENVVISPILDNQGRITHFLGLKEDITARKNAEMALQDSENKMQSIFRVAPTGIGVVKDRILIDVNPRVCEMVGYSKEELIGKSSRILYPSLEEYEYVGNEKYKLIEKYGTGTVETKWQKKDNMIIDVLLASTPIDEKDLAKGVIFTALDISARIQAEKDLQESENKLIEAQKIARMGYYVYNIESKTWENSAELDEILGIDDDFSRDIQGYFNLIHPDYRETISHYLTKHVLEQHNKFDKQYKIINQKTFEEKWVHTLGSLKFDAENNPVEMFGTIQDITEHKKLEEHLAQSQKMESIGKLTAGIAHDYNNIITAINGFAKLALDLTDRNSKVWNFLNEILDGGERAAKLTSQLLTFSRKQIIEPRIVDINMVIRQLDKMLSTIVGDGLDLNIKLDDTISPIKADISQLERVLINLVINAKEAIIEKNTPFGENQISIATREKYLDETFVKTHEDSYEGYHVLISISDTGTGIGKNDLSKIFEPFFTTKEKGKGTGLGLSSVYGIVKQNEASIYVNSKEGMGTEFNIYWPCINKERRQYDVERIQDKIVGGSESILVVEDDQSVAEFVNNFLTSLGYKIYIHLNGLDAWEFSKQNDEKFQLLLTDIFMPKMNGKELADKLLKIMPDLKVIYASGYSGDHLSNSGILYDNLNFVSKPYSMYTLAKKIREVLDKSD